MALTGLSMRGEDENRGALNAPTKPTIAIVRRASFTLLNRRARRGSTGRRNETADAAKEQRVSWPRSAPSWKLVPRASRRTSVASSRRTTSRTPDTCTGPTGARPYGSRKTCSTARQSGRSPFKTVGGAAPLPGRSPRDVSWWIVPKPPVRTPGPRRSRLRRRRRTRAATIAAIKEPRARRKRAAHARGQPERASPVRAPSPAPHGRSRVRMGNAPASPAPKRPRMTTRDAPFRPSRRGGEQRHQIRCASGPSRADAVSEPAARDFENRIGTAERRPTPTPCAPGSGPDPCE